MIFKKEIECPACGGVGVMSVQKKRYRTDGRSPPPDQYSCNACSEAGRLTATYKTSCESCEKCHGKGALQSERGRFSTRPFGASREDELNWERENLSTVECDKCYGTGKGINRIS